jgi:ribonuclease-3
MGLGADEKTRLKACEKRLGYRFRHREHLRRALTHRSFVNELRLPATEHNERYEFLGDAVLELAISRLLMERFPEAPEGELSKLRAAIVNESQLAELARGISLGDDLNLGKGEDQTGGRDKPSLLSDAFEAVLGAIYLDRGFDKAFDVIQRLYRSVLERAGGVGFIRDYKTRLQEVSQARFRAVPSYRLQRTAGPDHAKTFEVHLYIQNERWGVGRGASKKNAEQAAAAEALARLEGAVES